MLKIPSNDQKRGDEESGLEGCIRTLLAIERGSFPDEACRKCEHLEECVRLEPGVKRGLAGGR